LAQRLTVEGDLVVARHRCGGALVEGWRRWLGEDKSSDNSTVAENRGGHGGGLTQGERGRRGGGQEVHVPLFIGERRGQNR
jgi:hypothetical protein